MEKFQIDLGACTNVYAETVGMIIRHIYYQKTKVFKCCGIEGTYASGGNITALSNSDILAGNNMVYDLFLKINATDLRYLDRFSTMPAGGMAAIPGTSSMIYRISDKIFKIELDYTGRAIPLSELGAQTDENLLVNFSDITLKAKFYFIYDNGRFQEEYCRGLLDEQELKAITFPVMCAPAGNIGYEVANDKGVTYLILNYDQDFIDINNLISSVKSVLTELISLL